MALTYIQLEQKLKAISSCEETDALKKFTRKIAIVQKWIKKNLSTTNRKIEELNRSLETSQLWQHVEHEALLIQAHLYRWKKGLKTLIVDDWENDGKEISISLNPLLTASEEIQQRIRHSKKLHASLPHLAREIKKTERRRDALENQLKKLENLDEEEKLEPFLQGLRLNLGLPETVQSRKTEIAKKEKAKRPYHEFISAALIPIWVGKKAADNDKLTFSHANGDDYWLHASGFPGSHVVIRCKKAQSLDQETLQDALQLAIAYSKAKNSGQCEVVFTQCKYISRFGKGSPGKVQVSKHQLLSACLSSERLKNIKLRKL
ncbi:MAG: DUF814 domain-containing protein [Parachlamydiaceae bacterium]|nr:DUF814 domain-containing protein [Parachlamydiaceae bacterium]